MDDLILALRVIVMAVLLVSGVAKLFDRDGSAEAMIGFGMPLPLVPIAAAALPWIEIALAIGLVFASAQFWAAALAAALFLVFTVGVLRVVLAGENLDCHCFGQLQRAPVSWFTVARNVGLTIAAALIWWSAASRESTHLWQELTWMRVGVGAITLAVVAMAAAIYRLWQNQMELLGRIDALQAMIPAARTPKPPVEQSFARIADGVALQDRDGQSIAASALHAPKSPTLLVFVASTCRACTAILPDVAAWQQEFAGLMPVAVIGGGDANEIAAKIGAVGIEQYYLRTDSALPDALNVHGNPTAVLIDHDGFVRTKPILGGMQIRRLIDDLRAQAAG